MFLHYPVTHPKQFEVAQINRNYILFHIIRTFKMRKYLRIAFKGFSIFSIKALVDFAGGLCSIWGGSVTNMGSLYS